MEQFFSCLGAVLVLLLAVIPFAIRDIRRLDKKIEEVFDGREKLDDGRFYEKYFIAQGVPFYVVQGIRQIYADEFAVDLSRLSPKDDFSGNLKFLWQPDKMVDSMEDFYILSQIEKQFSIEFSRGEAEKINDTFENVINLVWRKIREKEISQN